MDETNADTDPADGGEDLLVHRSEFKAEGYTSLDGTQAVSSEIGQGKTTPVQPTSPYAKPVKA